MKVTKVVGDELLWDSRRNISRLVFHTSSPMVFVLANRPQTRQLEFMEASQCCHCERRLTINRPKPQEDPAYDWYEWKCKGCSKAARPAEYLPVAGASYYSQEALLLDSSERVSFDKFHQAIYSMVDRRGLFDSFTIIIEAEELARDLWDRLATRAGWNEFFLLPVDSVSGQ